MFTVVRGETVSKPSSACWPPTTSRARLHFFWGWSDNPPDEVTPHNGTGCQAAGGPPTSGASTRSLPPASTCLDHPRLRRAGTAHARVRRWSRPPAFGLLVGELYRRRAGGRCASAGRWGELTHRRRPTRGGAQRGGLPAQQGGRLARWHRGYESPKLTEHLGLVFVYC